LCAALLGDSVVKVAAIIDKNFNQFRFDELFELLFALNKLLVRLSHDVIDFIHE
jgi:hypothetical protein